jgi:uncharacterized protein YndB with AHSA1/START domain
VSGRAEVTGPGTIRLERVLPGTPERVWEYLVDPELRVTWFAGGTVEPWPGGLVDLRYDHSRISDEPVPEAFLDHRETGRVTACEPPRLLAFTWRDGPTASHVTVELTPVAGGTRLVLTHSRLDLPGDFGPAAAGWHVHLDMLEARIAGHPPEPFWARHEALEQLYEDNTTRDPQGGEQAPVRDAQG